MKPPKLLPETILIAHIVSFIKGDHYVTSKAMPGDKSDEDLIAEFADIGSEVRRFRIERCAQVTFEYAGLRERRCTEPICTSPFYDVQRKLSVEIPEDKREIPVHKKYRGTLRVIGPVDKVPQSTAA